MLHIKSYDSYDIKFWKNHASGLFELSNFNFRSTFPFENMFWSATFTGMK